MARRFLSLGAFLVALAICLGAFGAHGLALTEYSRIVYEKAVFYHTIHALGLVGLASLLSSGLVTERVARAVGELHIFGILFFSGSLYLLAVTGIRWLGAITPFGGVAFIAGWVLLSVASVRRAIVPVDAPR